MNRNYMQENGHKREEAFKLIFMKFHGNMHCPHHFLNNYVYMFDIKRIVL